LGPQFNPAAPIVDVSGFFQVIFLSLPPRPRFCNPSRAKKSPPLHGHLSCQHEHRSLLQMGPCSMSSSSFFGDQRPLAPSRTPFPPCLAAFSPPPIQSNRSAGPVHILFLPSPVCVLPLVVVVLCRTDTRFFFTGLPPFFRWRTEESWNLAFTNLCRWVLPGSLFLPVVTFFLPTATDTSARWSPPLHRRFEVKFMVTFRRLFPFLVRGAL